MNLKGFFKMYTRLFLSKAEAIAILLTLLILSISLIFEIYSSYSSYMIFHTLCEKNFLNTMLNILNITLIFIVLFLVIRESNLLENSFDVMSESSIGRKKVFLIKQITILSLILIISLAFYLIVFVPAYFLYPMFKFDFLKSYLYLLLFLIEMAEAGLFIAYLIKNYFIVLLFGIIVIIKGFIDIKYTNYIIPTLNIDKGFALDTNLYYVIIYVLVLVLLNGLIYNRSDRK